MRTDYRCCLCLERTHMMLRICFLCHESAYTFVDNDGDDGDYDNVDGGGGERDNHNGGDGY